MFWLEKIYLICAKDTLKKMRRWLQLSMMSTKSVFHCILMFINPARLFHDFQNFEWFVQRWMICNYDVECILYMFSDLYYVEWFILTWIFCTCNLECVLTMLKDLHCYWMTWRVQWNFLLEDIPRKVASEFSPPWKSQQWILLHEKNPPCGNSSGNNFFATNEKTDYL